MAEVQIRHPSCAGRRLAVVLCVPELRSELTRILTASGMGDFSDVGYSWDIGGDRAALHVRCSQPSGAGDPVTLSLDFPLGSPPHAAALRLVRRGAVLALVPLRAPEAPGADFAAVVEEYAVWLYGIGRGLECIDSLEEAS